MARSIAIVVYGNNDPKAFLEQHIPSDWNYTVCTNIQEIMLKEISILVRGNGTILDREVLCWLQETPDQQKTDKLFEAAIRLEIEKYQGHYIYINYRF